MDSEHARGAPELLPCPFCGATNVAQGVSSEEISVWCFCGARGPTVSFPEVCIDAASKVQECRAAWNRRGTSTPDISRILALVDHHVTDDDDRTTLRGAIIATTAALAASAEVAALIRDAEARGMERAAKEARETDYPWASPTNEQADACDQMAERIAGWLERCAAALRGEKEPK